MLRWILIIALACGCRDEPAKPPPPRVQPAQRAPDELARAVAAFHKSLDDGALPTAADPAFLVPPSDAELAWIRDRSQPMKERFERAMPLFDDTKAVMKKYGEHDAVTILREGTESLRWSEAAIREFGDLSALMADEFLPTLSPTDPKYEVRIEGLVKMAVGALGMLEGATITLRARQAAVEDRRALALAWRDHAADYAKIWNASQCKRGTAWLREILDKETDPELASTLGTIVTKLAICTGAHY